MKESSRPLAIIGGGLTGLVAAFHLRHNPPWPEVVLFESTDRLGGKIKTSTFAGATIEEGADSFLVRDPVVVDLCRELGIEGELIRPALFGAQIYSGGTLYPLPEGFLRGLPPSVRAALDAEILSTPGALRTLVDLAWPRRLSGPDVSFGRFVSRRFGREVSDKLVSAVMSGTRAGVPDEVSLAAGAAEIDAVARRNRSVMRGLKRSRSEGSLEAGPPPFRSLRPGLSRLIETLTDHLGSVDIRLNAPVDRIERDPGGYSVVSQGSRLRVAGAVVSAPAGASGRIVEAIAPDAARELARIRYSSSASVSLAYRPGTIRLPNGSGLLVPSGEKRAVSACTWFSRKWPHHAPSDGAEIVRAFIGRASEPGLDAPDEEMVAMAHRDLVEIVGADEVPMEASVTRWTDALPQYAVGHLESVDRIERALGGHPVLVAGAGLRGSGIPDCVTQGRSAASTLLARAVGSIA